MHAYPNSVHFQPRGKGAEAMLEKIFRPSAAHWQPCHNERLREIGKVQLHEDAAT